MNPDHASPTITYNYLDLTPYMQQGASGPVNHTSNVSRKLCPVLAKFKPNRPENTIVIAILLATSMLLAWLLQCPPLGEVARHSFPLLSAGALWKAQRKSLNISGFYLLSNVVPFKGL